MDRYELGRHAISGLSMDIVWSHVTISELCVVGCGCRSKHPKTWSLEEYCGLRAYYMLTTIRFNCQQNWGWTYMTNLYHGDSSLWQWIRHSYDLSKIWRNSYGHDLELAIISHKLCVSQFTRKRVDNFTCPFNTCIS